MPIHVPITPFVGRRRRKLAIVPVVGPALVSAAFDAPVLTIVFDRAVDLTGLLFDQIVVRDGSVPVEWAGTGDVTPIDDGCMITMIENAEYSGDTTTLSAPGGAGIVAEDGGEPWAGVVDLVLPWP